MPVPIPALTATARYLMSSGTRKAVKKYGKKAVDKAKTLIRQRRARQTATREGRTGTANSPRQTAVREGRMGANTSGRYSRARAQSEGRVGKFSDGGEVTSVRGAGKAVRGVRPAKIY
tara:strand:- start:1409 stop:1762 length:354 start_codon:yes stop_codon:yes gene_type:complete